MNEILRVNFLSFFKCLLVGVLSVGFLVSCDKSSEDNTEFTEVIRQLDEAEFFIQQEIMLKSTTPEVKQSLRRALREIRNGFIRLQKNVNDDLGFRLVERGLEQLKFYENEIQERDVSRLKTIVENVNAELHQVAKLTGRDVSFSWVLFTYRFSEEIEKVNKKGFRSWPESAWEPDWALDRPSIGVNGSKSAYLVTPTFDLTDIKDPTFNIVHTIQISRDRNRPKAPWNRKYILNNAFKAYASLDYISGDPHLCGCTWEPVDLGDLPTSKEFHSSESPNISLKKYQGQKVTLAFHFNTLPKPMGPHYINWDINLFQLKGSGPNVLYSSEKPPEALFLHRFNKESLNPFVKLSPLPEGNQWKPGKRPGEDDFEWVEVNHKNDQNNPEKRISSLLVSPLLSLDELVKPELEILEVINHSGSYDLSQLKIMVSTDYQGGNILEAKWIELQRSKDLEIPEKSWGDITSRFDFSEYSELNGESMTLLFWMQSEQSRVVWEIKNLKILANSGEVSSQAHSTPPFIPLLGQETTKP